MSKLKKLFKPELSENGVTIIELLISIAVGSIVLIMLMQMLVFNLNAQRRIEYDSTLYDQTYFLTEKIRTYAYDLQPHEIVKTIDNGTIIEIELRHLYDINVNAGNELYRDYSNPLTDRLTYNIANEEITYYHDSTGITETIHASSFKIESGSTLDVVSFGTIDGGSLTLTLTVSVQLPSGSRLSSRQFITTIII